MDRGEAADPMPPLLEEEPAIESPADHDLQRECPALPSVPSSMNLYRRRSVFVQLVAISATLSIAAMVAFTGYPSHVIGSCGGGNGTSFEPLSRGSDEDISSRFATKDDELRILVEDCARKLELPEDVCDPEKPISKNSFQVPLMSSGNLDCGFEVRFQEVLLLTMSIDCQPCGDTCSSAACSRLMSRTVPYGLPCMHMLPTESYFLI